MININKRQFKGNLLIDANARGLSYKDLPDTSEIRKQLIEEQGFICAYCMSRIRPKEDGKVTETKIEHILAQNSKSVAPEELRKDSLDYKNMVLCCMGGEGLPKDEQYCDSHKGNDLIPFIKEHLHNDIENFIKYDSTGIVDSNNAQLNKEIGYLNLNAGKYLKKGRKETLDQLKLKIISKGLKKEDYRALFDEIRKDNQYTPYVGIIFWYLKRSF